MIISQQLEQRVSSGGDMSVQLLKSAFLIEQINKSLNWQYLTILFQVLMSEFLTKVYMDHFKLQNKSKAEKCIKETVFEDADDDDDQGKNKKGKRKEFSFSRKDKQEFSRNSKKKKKLID